MHLVIIGNGVAGMEAALAVRLRDQDARVTIVSEESDHFFSRTALMYVLCGQLSHACIEPLERDVYERLGLTRVRARAVGIDPDAKRVHLAGSASPLTYDRLLIACGSRPRPGPWDGASLPGVGHFVTLQDLSWLEEELHGDPKSEPPNAWSHLAATTDDSPYRRRAAVAATRGHTARHPVVVGGGLIGIEAIETMLAAGLRPRFVIREEWFWPKPIDARESAWVTERMRHHGVEVDLGTSVACFEAGPDGGVARIVTDEGSHDCDCAVIAIGVLPNTDWLADSPIERDRFGGLIVGDDLQTNVPGVYAAGDCASVRWFDGQQRPEQLWYTARDQGRLAARALLGDDVHYRRGSWYNSAKLMDIEYTTAGLVGFGLDGETEWFHEESGAVRSTTRIVSRDGAVIGFNFLGRRWDHSVLLRWIDERRSLAWVKRHLNEARFDTELVPPLRLPS